MSLETITNQIKEKLNLAPPFGATFKIDLGDDGIIFVDGTGPAPEFSHEDAEATTTLTCSIATIEGILNGTQDPNMAFMMGKLKVKGSMGYAMKLNSLLED